MPRHNFWWIKKDENGIGFDINLLLLNFHITHSSWCSFRRMWQIWNSVDHHDKWWIVTFVTIELLFYKGINKKNINRIFWKNWSVFHSHFFWNNRSIKCEFPACLFLRYKYLLIANCKGKGKSNFIRWKSSPSLYWQSRELPCSWLQFRLLTIFMW